jgi:hypothetical protein
MKLNQTEFLESGFEANKNESNARRKFLSLRDVKLKIRKL